ncbi:Unsaturated rhamnogalacturonyl hydrolase YteR [Halioglobus japonicus]|nr:Unsaturated rhamnogalacturonyl hydrolase YteR [Halioglobus japonicus]
MPERANTQKKPSADHYFTRVLELADDSIKRYDPTRLKWMWGEALYTYSLHLLDTALGEDRYLDYICAYLDAHIKKGYRVDQSDTMAPGLTAYAAYLRTGDARYKAIIDRVVEYLLNSDRVLDYMPNHLGSSWEGKLYPRSVWVDSVMMYGVFSGWYGSVAGDTAIYDFARRQPNLFARYLQDPQDKLFYHCYWTRQQHTYPKNKVFWARGNGWVIAGLPLAIDHFAADSQERSDAIRILHETSEALLPYQRDDGFYETVFNRPGKTYIESSGTALIASGWMQGVADGYLDQKYLAPGLQAYRAVVDTLETKDGLLSMPLISAPTIPLQVIPYLGYKYTPRGNDWTYGLASLFFAGLNYKKLLDQNRVN